MDEPVECDVENELNEKLCKGKVEVYMVFDEDVCGIMYF